MRERLFEGLGVSAGIAQGRAFLLHAEPLPVVPNPIPPERVEEEVERFRKACEVAGRELEDLKRQVHDALGDRYAGILEAQKLILEDPTLVGETTSRIRVGRVSARWALKEVVGEFMRKFEAVDDEYIRERGGELADVQRRVQRLLRGESPFDHALPDEPMIVVAHAVGPSDVMLLAREQVVGLATDVGGRTSHTAILAQALTLPTLVGLHDFSRRVRLGDRLLLDADRGTVTIEPSPEESEQAEQRQQASLVLEGEMADARDLPAVTRDGINVVIRANVEFPSELDRAIRFGAQGIGLYRSEFLFVSRAPHLPTEEEHYETYVEIARRIAPRPVVVRTLDLGGEKYFHEVLDRRDASPVLGLRGVRFCLRRPDVFRPQLRALLRAAAIQNNLKVLLPMVCAVEEVRAVRALMAEEAAALRAEGVEVHSDVPLGAMIEVPAAALTCDRLADEVDFFSIGTNDLIQYALAVDRGNESLAELYQPFHPGLLRLIRMVVEAADRRGLSVAMCGEMAADVLAVPLLVGLGLRDLSVQPRAVAAVRAVVRGLDSVEAQRMAEEALERPTAAEVESALKPAR